MRVQAHVPEDLPPHGPLHWTTRDGDSRLQQTVCVRVSVEQSGGQAEKGDTRSEPPEKILICYLPYYNHANTQQRRGEKGERTYKI
jgi:hypothetical protein